MLINIKMRFRIECIVLIIILYFFFQVMFVFYSNHTISFLNYTSLSESSASKVFEYNQHTATKYIFKELLNDNTGIDSPQCSFPDPQFTKEEIDYIFHYTHYPRCSTTTKLNLSISNHSIYAKCSNMQSPKFLQDPTTRQTLGGNLKPQVNWAQSPQLNSKSEFIIIKCGKRSTYTQILFKFNPKVSKKANQKRRELGWNNKNFNVFILLFDQVSRYSVQRNWPKTSEFLNDFNSDSRFKSSISLYSFEKTPSVNPYTLNNMIPILYGKDYKEIKLKLGSKKLEPFEYSKRHIYYQYKYSIWKFYSSLGYTTMFLKDTVYDFLALALGRDIATDHSFLNYWRTAYAVYGWSDFHDKQRCAGDRDSHEISLDYFYQYVEAYKENNKFAYVHLSAAHERSGNVLTVDKDLPLFFEKFFGLMNARNEDFVFLLMSDHGIKYMTNYQWDIRTFYESVDPMFYVFVSKDVKEKWNLDGLLRHNSKAIVGRFDINLSLKDLAYFPYDRVRETYYDYYKSEYSIPGVSSIFYEKISFSRTCSDILVDSDYCLCKKPTDLDSYNINSELLLDHLKSLTSKYFTLQSQRDQDCQKLDYYSLINSKHLKIEEAKQGGDTIIYLELASIHETTIQVFARFCGQKKIELSGAILPEDIYPYIYFLSNRKYFFLQIASVDVLNSKCGKNCLC